MATQMFLVQPKNNEDDGARETIAEFIVQRGGFILMATSDGALIAAFDEMYLDAVKQHYLVDFASGVMLNPNGPGAAALQKIFVQNLAAQMVERGITQPQRTEPGQPLDSAEGSFPPGYRPLRWPARNYWDEEAGGE